MNTTQPLPRFARVRRLAVPHVSAFEVLATVLLFLAIAAAVARG